MMQRSSPVSGTEILAKAGIDSEVTRESVQGNPAMLDMLQAVWRAGLMSGKPEENKQVFSYLHYATQFFNDPELSKSRYAEPPPEEKIGDFVALIDHLAGTGALSAAGIKKIISDSLPDRSVGALCVLLKKLHSLKKEYIEKILGRPGTWLALSRYIEKFDQTNDCLLYALPRLENTEVSLVSLYHSLWRNPIDYGKPNTWVTPRIFKVLVDHQDDQGALMTAFAYLDKQGWLKTYSDKLIAHPGFGRSLATLVHDEIFTEENIQAAFKNVYFRKAIRFCVAVGYLSAYSNHNKGAVLTILNQPKLAKAIAKLEDLYDQAKEQDPKLPPKAFMPDLQRILACKQARSWSSLLSPSSLFSYSAAEPTYRSCLEQTRKERKLEKSTKAMKL